MKREREGDDARPTKYQATGAPARATRSPPALAPVLTAVEATAVEATGVPVLSAYEPNPAYDSPPAADACKLEDVAAAGSLPILHPPQPVAPCAAAESGHGENTRGGGYAGRPPSPSPAESAAQNSDTMAVIVATAATIEVRYVWQPPGTESTAPSPSDSAPDSNSGPDSEPDMNGVRAQSPMPSEPDAVAVPPWRRTAAVGHANARAGMAQNVADRSESVPLPQRGLTSRYRGVSLKSGRKTNPWKAVITVHNQTMHLGYFKSEEQAAAAYDTVAMANGRATNLCVPQMGAAPAGPCVKLAMGLAQGTCHGEALAKRSSQVRMAPKPSPAHGMPCNSGMALSLGGMGGVRGMLPMGLSPASSVFYGAGGFMDGQQLAQLGCCGAHPQVRFFLIFFYV
ncbi:hypothetical protein T492DRAFT_463660 [Pavlovales sp. CCMP2436]|nr:hypothetical protein T492DRAFT_463660 [Pavlovales sp. CCMP2436]